MTFKIHRASDFEFEDEKTFATLEELKEYVATLNSKTKKACVIYFDDLELIIYESWIE